MNTERRIRAIGRELARLGVTQRVDATEPTRVHVLFDDRTGGVYLIAGDHPAVLQTHADSIRVTGRHAAKVARDIALTLKAGTGNEER